MNTKNFASVGFAFAFSFDELLSMGLVYTDLTLMHKYVILCAIMIRIIAGGKKNKDWLAEACEEYEKRLKKPFDLQWQFVDESELDAKVLALGKDNYVILLDERGEILSSPALSR